MKIAEIFSLGHGGGYGGRRGGYGRGGYNRGYYGGRHEEGRNNGGLINISLGGDR